MPYITPSRRVRILRRTFVAVASAGLAGAVAVTMAPSAPADPSNTTAQPAAVSGSLSFGNADTQSAPPTAGQSAPTTTTRMPVNQLRVMNWYPAANSWNNAWTRYNHTVVASDFAAIKSMNANTVRIIVQPAAIGYPTITPAGAAAFKDSLITARGAGLSVQLTLFDLWGNYTQVTGSTAWLKSLASLIPDMNQIPLVELQNEIDPSSKAAMTWAGAMLPTLSTIFPGVPRTLTVQGASRVPGLSSLLSQVGANMDVIDVHLYDDWGHATQTLKAAKSMAAGRPVIVGEVGQSTVNSAPASMQSQATMFSVMGALTNALQLPPPAPWTLNDFVPSGINGGPSKPAELSFGLRDTTGAWKPAAYAVQQVFGAFAASQNTPQKVTASSGSTASGLATSVFDGGMEVETPTPYGGSLLGAWKMQNADLAAAMGVSSTNARSGSRAAFMTNTQNLPSRVASFYQNFPAPLAGSVTVSVWALAVNASRYSNNRIAVAWFDADGRFLGQTESASLNPMSTQWQQLSVTSTAPAGAVSTQIALKSAANSGSVYWDDVSMSGLP